jgi:hypothetical protein
MANPNVEKTLHEYSAPSADQVPTGPEINTENGNFEIKTASLRWYRLAHYVASLMKTQAPICNSSGKAKQWIYTNREEINTWAKCSVEFLMKFFPLGKTNAPRVTPQVFNYRH